AGSTIPANSPAPQHHGATGRGRPPHLSHHLGPGRRTRRPRVLPAGAAIRHSSVCWPVVRTDHLPDLRAGRAWQFRWRLCRGFRVRRDHLARRAVLGSRVGLRAGLRLLHRHDVHQARRAAGEALVTIRQLGPWIDGAALIVLPIVSREPYHLHLVILILIWSFAYTSLSIMGRFT